ncbi:hypothetical protein D3C73_1660940 [compost metagenome]
MYNSGTKGILVIIILCMLISCASNNYGNGDKSARIEANLWEESLVSYISQEYEDTYKKNIELFEYNDLPRS